MPPIPPPIRAFTLLCLVITCKKYYFEQLRLRSKIIVVVKNDKIRVRISCLCIFISNFFVCVCVCVCGGGVLSPKRAQNKKLIVSPLPTDSTKWPYSTHFICQFQIKILFCSFCKQKSKLCHILLHLHTHFLA
jgi:hypothetical protein